MDSRIYPNGEFSGGLPDYVRSDKLAAAEQSLRNATARIDKTQKDAAALVDKTEKKFRNYQKKRQKKQERAIKVHNSVYISQIDNLNKEISDLKSELDKKDLYIKELESRLSSKTS